LATFGCPSLSWHGNFGVLAIDYDYSERRAIHILLGGANLLLITSSDVVLLSNLALWRSVVEAVDTTGSMIGGPLGSKIATASNWHV
jgi:hypothetical protein